MITDTSVTNKILTFSRQILLTFPRRFFWGKNGKKPQKSTFVESKLHQTDKEPMIHAHEDFFNYN